jgi:hypothetical protein
MENVTRYTCGAGDGMFESKEGYYVDYADYKILLDKYNQALSQHDVIKNEVAVCENCKVPSTGLDIGFGKCLSCDKEL